MIVYQRKVTIDNLEQKPSLVRSKKSHGRLLEPRLEQIITTLFMMRYIPLGIDVDDVFSVSMSVSLNGSSSMVPVKYTS